MGVIKQGILGGFQNKVGAVIGSNWKGIATMRSRPISVANPRTGKQVAVRSVFTTLVKMASALNATLIRPYWSRFAQKKTGANAFISANYGKMAGNIGQIPDHMILSQGKLDGLAEFVCGFAGADYQLVWDEATLGVYGATTDKVSIFALLGTSDEAGRNSVQYKYLGETTRGAGSFIVDPGELAPEITEVVGTRFVACVSRLDGTMVSNSQAVHEGM
jgi:hypothetical protein